MKKPNIIAHRGASAYAPENTLAAFRKAIELGSGGIELDVHLSKDSKVVVIHDERVERTSTGSGFVKDLTHNEMSCFDFGNWFSDEFTGERIPLLEEFLKLVKGFDGLLNIEIKNDRVQYPGIEEKVLELVHKYEASDKVIISSFNHYSLVKIRNLDNKVKTGVLYMELLYRPWEYAKTIGANAIHPYFYAINEDIVRGCIENGVEVNVFTVDDIEKMKFLAAIGVTGIITNVPDLTI